MDTLKRFTVPGDLNKYLHRLDWDDKLAVATSSERVQNDCSLSKFVHCFDEPNHIQNHPFKIFMRKDFPLRSELNQFIERVTEAGLIEKWAKIRSFPMEKPPKFAYSEITKEVYFIFTCLAGGLVSLAVITLIVERIVYKKVRTSAASRVWRYIEITIDPYRYFLLNDWSY